ncbi:MAG: sugar phosphate isomerase/epimerase [Bryobacter sp.]|jgi:sugar phosphate isomerase/epimerase|nr:sugar phosphate isomerase/epimerase [Bryobacter sp.]
MALKLGIDTYSIRAYRWKAPQLLEYAVQQKLDVLHIGVLTEMESQEPAALAQFKDAAAAKGVELEAGIGCVCPASKSFNPKEKDAAEYLRRGLRAAAAIGAPSLRVFLSSPAERAAMPAIMDSALPVLRAVRAEAQDRRVKVAIENHGDMTARELRQLIEAAGKEHVGVCLDTGNPMAVLEDPVQTVEVLAPYIVTTHLRDSALCAHPRGAQYQWVALGDGSAHLKEAIDAMIKAAPQAPLNLEVITGRPPYILPYLEPDFWKLFPNLPAADFARFLALVRQGEPYRGPMVIAGAGKQLPEIDAALKLQQRTDLERSLEYMRRVIGAGHNMA